MQLGHKTALHVLSLLLLARKFCVSSASCSLPPFQAGRAICWQWFCRMGSHSQQASRFLEIVVCGDFQPALASRVLPCRNFYCIQPRCALKVCSEAHVLERAEQRTGISCVQSLFVGLVPDAGGFFARDVPVRSLGYRCVEGKRRRAFSHAPLARARCVCRSNPARSSDLCIRRAETPAR